MSITQRHVQKVLIDQAVNEAYAQSAMRQTLNSAQRGGNGLLPLQLQNGAYDSGGGWSDYLICDATVISKGVLR